MKIKLYEILNSIDILQQLRNQKFSIKVSYKIQRNLKQIQNEIDEINKIKKELIDKYSEDLEDKKKFIPENKIEKINKELQDLLEEEIELDILKINIDEFILDISPNELSKIEWMIEFKEE